MGKLKELRVVLDPGHGAGDPGAVGGGLKESEQNLKVVGMIKDALLLRGVGEIFTTRDDETDPINNKKRVVDSNKFNPDLYVAIHHNADAAHKGEGFMILVSGSGKSQQLAEHINREVITGVPIKNLGIKKESQVGRGSGFRLRVLHETNCPAVLVECAFISNEKDRAFIREREGILAKAIANGIISFAQDALGFKA